MNEETLSVNNSISPRRKEWVDALRAIAMLLVIIGHVLPDNCDTYFILTSPVKIPLFFAITGYVFNDRNGNGKEFFANLLKKLVLPWLILTIVPTLAISVIKGRDYLFSHVVAILTGKSFWYMPCCIIAEIIYFYIRKVGKSLTLISAASLVCFAAGLILSHFDVLSVCMINTALVCQPYILLGYVIRRYEASIKSMKRPYIIIGAVLYLCLFALSMAVFPGKSLDVHTSSYYCLPLCLVMIAEGCVVLFAAGMRTEKYPRAITFIGQNTLVYYLMSSYADLCGKSLLKALGIKELSSIPMLALRVIIICIICGIISAVINRICPRAVGKKRCIR